MFIRFSLRERPRERGNEQISSRLGFQLTISGLDELTYVSSLMCGREYSLSAKGGVRATWE